MKMVYLLIAFFTMTSAHADDCWVFKKIDRGSQIRSLKIKMGPSEDAKSADPDYVAKVEAKDLEGAHLGGQVGCKKTSPTRWQCHRSDDGGSFELSLEKESVVFSTSYFVLGTDADHLTLQSDPNDPWVFDGDKCR